MFKIEDDFIYLTRGDTAYITLELEDEDKFFVGDIVALSVKRNLTSESIYALHKEKIVDEESNTLVIKIKPEDTNDMSYGLYYYDIQLTRTNGDVFTIITPDKDDLRANFKLLKEVTQNE